MTLYPISKCTPQRAADMIEKYGTAYIFLYRYPKGMRTIGALPVGLTNISWLKFTLLNGASALLWTGLLVGAGYSFGPQSNAIPLNDHFTIDNGEGFSSHCIRC